MELYSRAWTLPLKQVDREISRTKSFNRCFRLRIIFISYTGVHELVQIWSIYARKRCTRISVEWSPVISYTNCRRSCIDRYFFYIYSVYSVYIKKSICTKSNAVFSETYFFDAPSGARIFGQTTWLTSTHLRRKKRHGRRNLNGESTVWWTDLSKYRSTRNSALSDPGSRSPILAEFSLPSTIFLYVHELWISWLSMKKLQIEMENFTSRKKDEKIDWNSVI